ncbi:MAG TPA: hypothetical protein VF235_00425, partial [Actinomycetota bacterium]
NDTITAGSGIDSLDYSRATNRVIVSLVDLTATGQGTDTFTGIEDVIGSNYNDTISGDGNDNVLNGRSGNDSLSGLGGADSLIGGAGRDAMNGGAGDDTCAGGSGSPDTGTSCETETGIP